MQVSDLTADGHGLTKTKRPAGLSHVRAGRYAVHSDADPDQRTVGVGTGDRSSRVGQVDDRRFDTHGGQGGQHGVEAVNLHPGERIVGHIGR